ncbi:plasmid replication DNA-binding protein [Acinetobacter faecalis]|uniref:plasmid replication DNA-binding protein n=1 Tax=Acinetobacter faecalis TaxID=2665161 RepID=UPI002A91ED8E|nr:plasmid replication DNA-binding protein [Acinetobacter faecalis]MDY6469402.1 plasmid replication DNA-binding protein [Acinetobacter faecalis]
MSRINISQASKKFNVSRNTLYKYIKSGKLTKDSEGLVDTADMIRLFSLHVNSQSPSTTDDSQPEHDITQYQHREQLLQKQVEQLQLQVSSLERQLQYVQANEAWLKQQLDQKLIEHKNNDKKGLLGRLFG